MEKFSRNENAKLLADHSSDWFYDSLKTDPFPSSGSQKNDWNVSGFKFKNWFEERERVWTLLFEE